MDANETLEYHNSTTFAEVLGISRARFSVLKNQDRVPEPDAFVNGQPIWSPETVEKFKLARSTNS